MLSTNFLLILILGSSLEAHNADIFRKWVLKKLKWLPLKYLADG
jgi:hypothetical protein